MDLKLVHKPAVSDTVEAISSKSYVHRLLIAAALCEEDVTIASNIVSKDMEATVGVLCALGFHVSIRRRDDGHVLFETAGSRGFCSGIDNTSQPAGVIADCKESGSTARFLLPLAGFVSDGATLTGSGKLPERPMGPLCEQLRLAGVKVSSNHLPITVSGRPHSGNYELPGDVSSQFISGLLFMLPLLDGDSHLKITGLLESAAYVEMTLDVLARFGITICRCADGFDIPGGQKYTAGKVLIQAEGDWSNGAYIMALGLLGGIRTGNALTVTGLDPDSIQGDRKSIDIFKQFGAEVSVGPDPQEHMVDIVISGKPEDPVDIDCSQIPDLVPALAAVAAFCDGSSTFGNVGRLRMKECDRIEAVVEMLAAIGIKVDITTRPAAAGEVDITSQNPIEDMTVHGRGNHPDIEGPVIIRTHNDHRMAMAASAIAAALDVPVVIKDAMAVDKSYPGYYEVIDKLGIGREITDVI